MLAQGGRFLFGLFTGLLVGGLLYLVLAEPRGVAIELLPPPSPAPLRIHVAGAVVSPGVYSLPAGSIVADAVRAAGGSRPGGDLDVLNLAAPVADGERVFVPMEGALLPADASGAAQTGLLDLNTASSAELEGLPGIGPTLANAIVSFRDQNGPFHAVDDLVLVPGIGPTRLSQLRDLITVE